MNGEFKVMVIGAHPDDCDIISGCTTLRLAEKGARVRYVSVCNGNMGHRTMPMKELAARRFGEAQAAAQMLGVEDYTVLDHGDCTLEPTLELRAELTRVIRRFAPDVVITHRTCDYHADHRAVAQAVMDASYLLGVPRWCEDVPRPDRLPAVLLLRDAFTTPREIRPDVVVDATPYVDRWCDAIASHVSQFREWLPYDRGIEGEVPDWDDVPARRAFLMKYWGDARKGFDAKRFGAKFPLVEVFEISQYGRAPTAEDLKWFES